MRIMLTWVNTRYSVGVSSELANSAYSFALKRGYEDHVFTNTSEVVNAITTKSNVVIFKVILPLLIIFNSVILAFALAFAILYINPSIAVMVFGCLTLIYIIIFKGVRALVAADGVTIARESDDVIRIVQEGLGGIRDVLIDGADDFHVELWMHHIVLPLRRCRCRIEGFRSSSGFAVSLEQECKRVNDT